MPANEQTVEQAPRPQDDPRSGNHTCAECNHPKISHHYEKDGHGSCYVCKCPKYTAAASSPAARVEQPTPEDNCPEWLCALDKGHVGAHSPFAPAAPVVAQLNTVKPYVMGVIPWRAEGPGWANQGVTVIKDDRQGKIYTECLYLKDHPQLHDVWAVGIAAYNILLREVEKIEAASQRTEGEGQHGKS